MEDREFRNIVKGKEHSAEMLKVDEVIATKGFENLTREQAEEYIQALIQFCVIAYTTYSKLEAKNENETDNTLAA